MPVYKFNVEMTCGGCSTAITNILNKKLGKGETFDIDLPNKVVTITTDDRSLDDLLEILKKSGKEVSLRQA